MIFEFNNQLVPQNLIDIDQVGEFGIEASNDDGFYYYMVIKTILGTSVVATCGPVFPDSILLPSGFSCTLNKMPYKEDKLAKTINLFLNDRYRQITSAHIIDVQEAIDQFREVKDYLTNFQEDTF